MAERDAGKYDDPVLEEEWLSAQKKNAIDYLAREGVANSGQLELCWHVAPYVSLWVDRGCRQPRCTWVIGGDLPTDYLHLDSGQEAREAMRAIAARWKEVSACMSDGRPHPKVRIGDSADSREQRQLGDLLRRRADLLAAWADDDSYW